MVSTLYDDTQLNERVGELVRQQREQRNAADTALDDAVGEGVRQLRASGFSMAPSKGIPSGTEEMVEAMSLQSEFARDTLKHINEIGSLEQSFGTNAPARKKMYDFQLETLGRIEPTLDFSPEKLLNPDTFREALAKAPTKEAQFSLAQQRQKFFNENIDLAAQQRYVSKETIKSHEEAKKNLIWGFNSRFSKEIKKGTAVTIGGIARFAQDFSKEFGVDIGGDKFADEMKDYVQSAGLSVPEADGVLEGLTSLFGSNLPYMLGAAAGAVFGAAPAAFTAFAVGLATEGEAMYQESLQMDLPLNKANYLRYGVGLLNAAVEVSQVGLLFRFAKFGLGSKKRLLDLTKGILVREARKKTLKNLGVEAVKVAFQEGGQEFVQESITQGAPGIMYGRWPVDKDGTIDWGKMIARSAEAFAGGAIVGTTIGVGGRILANTLYGDMEADDKNNFYADYSHSLRTNEEIEADKPYLTPFGLEPARFMTAETSVAQRIAERFKRKVVIFEYPGEGKGITSDSFVDDGIIYFSDQSTQPGRRAVSHEITHLIQESDPKMYEEVAAVAAEYLGERKLKLLVKSLNTILGKGKMENGVKVIADAKDEAVAEYVGALAEHTNLMESLGNVNPTLLDNMGYYVQDLLDRMVGLQNIHDIDNHFQNWRRAGVKMSQILSRYKYEGEVPPPRSMVPVQSQGPTPGVGLFGQPITEMPTGEQGATFRPEEYPAFIPGQMELTEVRKAEGKVIPSPSPVKAPAKIVEKKERAEKAVKAKEEPVAEKQPEKAETTKIYTSVPEEWKAEKELLDFGRKGLKLPGKKKIKGKGTFKWISDFEQVPTRIFPPVLRYMQREAGEEFYRVRSFTKQRENYWLFPKQVVEKARKKFGEKLMNREPKAKAKFSQKVQYAVASMKRAELDNIDIARNIVDMMVEDGKDMPDLSEGQRALVEALLQHEDYKGKALKDISKGVQQEIPTAPKRELSPEEIAEREAIQREDEVAGIEIGDFLEGLLPPEQVSQKEVAASAKRQFGTNKPYDQTLKQFGARMEKLGLEFNFPVSRQAINAGWLAELWDAAESGEVLRETVQESLAKLNHNEWRAIAEKYPKSVGDYVPSVIADLQSDFQRKLEEGRKYVKGLKKKKPPEIKQTIRRDVMAERLVKFHGEATGIGRTHGAKYWVAIDGTPVNVSESHVWTAQNAGADSGALFAEGALRINIVPKINLRTSNYTATDRMSIVSPVYVTPQQLSWIGEVLRSRDISDIHFIYWDNKAEPQSRAIEVDTTDKTSIRRALAEIERLQSNIPIIKQSLRRDIMLKRYFDFAVGERKGLKKAIARSVGMEPEGEDERVALKSKLELAKKAAMDGYKLGRQVAKIMLAKEKLKGKLLKDLRKQLAKETKRLLPVRERQRMLMAVTDVTSTEDFYKKIQKLDEYYEKSLKKIQIARLKKVMRNLNKKYRRRGKGTPGYKVLPEIEVLIKEITDSFSLTTPSPKVRDALVELAGMAKDVAERKRLEGADDPFTKFEIYDLYDKLKNKLDKVPVSQLTTEEIEGLADSILILIKQHETEMLVRSDERNQQADILEEGIVAEIQSNWRKERPIETEYSTKKGKPGRWKWWTGIFGRHMMNLATLSRVLSGMKKSSMTEQVFSQNLVEGVDNSLQHYYKIRDFAYQRLLDAGITDKDIRSWSKFTKRSTALGKFATFMREHTPFSEQIEKVEESTKYITVPLEEGKNLTISVGEALDILMHSRNGYNYDAITGENGVSISHVDIPKLTSVDVDNVIDALDKATEGKASKMADIMGEALQIQADAINEVSVRLYGYELANIPNWWHITRRMPKKAKGPQQEFAYQTVESRSHFKERMGSTAPVVIGDALNNFVDSINVGKDFVGLAEPMRTARYFIGSPAIQDMMKRKGYETYIKEIIDKLNGIQESDPKHNIIETMVGKMQRNMTRGIFSWNARLAITQYFSVLMALDDMPLKHLKAIRFMKTKEIEREAYLHSPMIRQRYEGYIGRELGDVASTGSTLRFFTGKDMYINTPTRWITDLDKFAILDIWRMAKSVVADEYVKTGKLTEGTTAYWETVRVIAEKTIRKTQPTWHDVDRSLLGSMKNPVAKSLTMFHSQREKMMQIVLEANSKFANSGRTKADFAKLSYSYGIVLSNLFLVALWKKMWKVVVEGDDDRDPLDVIEDTVVDIPGLIYFVGPVARDSIAGALHTLRGKPPISRGELSFPPNRIAKMYWDSHIEWAKWARYAIEGDVRSTGQFGSAAGKTWDLAQYLFGLPLLEGTKLVRKNYKRFSE